MNKKIYNTPLVKVIQLDTTAILAGSTPTSKKIFDDPVEEYQGEGEAPSGWGEQW